MSAKTMMIICLGFLVVLFAFGAADAFSTGAWAAGVVLSLLTLWFAWLAADWSVWRP